MQDEDAGRPYRKFFWAPHQGTAISFFFFFLSNKTFLIYVNTQPFQFGLWDNIASLKF